MAYHDDVFYVICFTTFFLNLSILCICSFRQWLSHILFFLDRNVYLHTIAIDFKRTYTFNITCVYNVHLQIVAK